MSNGKKGVSIYLLPSKSTKKPKITHPVTQSRSRTSKYSVWYSREDARRRESQQVKVELLSWDVVDIGSWGGGSLSSLMMLL